MSPNAAHGGTAAHESVVVTGIGLVTALGFGVAETWPRLLAGQSAVRPLSREAFALPIPLPAVPAAPVERAALAERIRAAVPRSVWNTSAEVTHLWLLAALEAMRHASLEPASGAPDPARVGVYVGCGGGAATNTEAEYVRIFTAEKAVQRDVARMAIPKYMHSALAGQLSILKGLRGPAVVVDTACSAGASALVTALDALRLGRVDCAVAGGADLPITAATLKGFHNLGVLATTYEDAARAHRPFDAGRDGLVLGEGAACLVLERADTARARGARPLAVLQGGALTGEAHNLLSPRDDGEGMADCMALALADAGLQADRVAHVYAHGTGTLYNDRCEAAALARLFPHGPTVSATKAQLGHTLGAGGAIDAALAVLGLQDSTVVPLAHLDRPDPDCPIVPAREVVHPALRANGGPPAAVLVNAFAFGGHNAVLAFSGPGGT